VPVYESECLQCGRRHDYIRTVAQCHDTPTCCGETTAKRIFSAPAGFPDIPAYESPASGRMITSRAERREDFKRTNTREWEGLAAEKSEAARQIQYAEQDLDRRVERTIGETLAALPPSKQDALMAA
jgi:putative FmdB family regulatory protein